MDRCRVSIVIPALNESATIKDIVESAILYGVPIVVDDGSTDNTAELATQAGAVVVIHEKNYGYDAALNSGFKKAVMLGTQVIITLDADGQHDPTLIQQFIDAIDAGNDVVVGVRSRRQRLAEHLFAWYAGIRFKVKDPLCGMKAYRTDVHKALGHFDSYGSIGTELTIFAAMNGYRVGQIYFDVRERSGQSRFGQVLSGNYKIIRAMVLSILRLK
jgi:glycosyltransferase involved in cell wall biosynthesis